MRSEFSKAGNIKLTSCGMRRRVIW